MMGIRKSFDLSMFTAESGSELIGQSSEVPMHKRISQEIKKHIFSHMSNIKQGISRPLRPQLASA